MHCTMRSILAFLAFATSLPYIFADTAIAERSHKTDDGYSPIQIGVMMLDGKVRHAHRRRSESNDNSPPSPRSSRRDYAQSVGLLKQSPDGKICYPDEEGQDHGRSEAEKRDLSAFKGIITWYTGGDLLNRRHWCIMRDNFGCSTDKLTYRLVLQLRAYRMGAGTLLTTA